MLVIRQNSRTHREIEKVLALLRETAAKDKPPAGKPFKLGDKQERGAELRVFYLKLAKAEDAAKLLANALSASRSHVAIDARLNAIIVQAEPATLETIEALLRTIDAEKPK
jgi:type II secretory pathway component GspD/PulD (secretin)